MRIKYKWIITETICTTSYYKYDIISYVWNNVYLWNPYEVVSSPNGYKLIKEGKCVDDEASTDDCYDSCQYEYNL